MPAGHGSVTLALAGLTVTKRSIAAAAPVAPIPSNYDFIAYGDSRTEDGIGSAASQTNGYAPFTQNLGAAAWLPLLSQNRLRLGRYANFGISASTTTQGAAAPRLDANSVASTGRWDRPSGSTNYASNKGAADAQAHSAGIVVLLYGTNDGTNIPLTTESNLVAIMNGIGSGKTILLLNELPRGIDHTGAVLNAASNPVDRFNLSRELLKYDYASGDAKARANVIAVNSFDAFLDGTTGANYYNLRGLLRDGLHVTPYGGKATAAAIIARLDTAWPNWRTALPNKVSLPTVNGLVTPANTQPFIHTNPNLTPGTNGTVSGTWASAPAAANVPQGWTVNMLANGTGITGVGEKGVETDPDGFPVFKLTLSGTVAANTTATIQIYQTLASAALATAIAGGYVSINDKFRAVGRAKVDAGSSRLIGVDLAAVVQDSTASKTQTARAMAGSIGVALNEGFMANNYLDAFGDAAWYDLMTELLDCQDPNRIADGTNVAAFSQLLARWQIIFRNNLATTQNVSATVRISRTGMARI